jgi:hypothetical protein
MRSELEGFLIAMLSIPVIVACSTASQTSEPIAFDTNQSHLEITLSFNPDLYQKPAFFLPKAYPSFAIWIADPATEDLETIYVTGKAGQNKWVAADERPESVPVWFGQRKKAGAGAASDVDTMTGATPSGENTVIYWPVPASWQGRQAHVYIEANISFDYNDHFTDKKGTSGYSGVNGQPSVVWLAKLDISAGDQLDVGPEIVGHGHVSGADHLIDPDMSRLTTATRIFQYIGINYYSGNR